MDRPLGKMRTTIRLTVVGVFLLGIILTAAMAIGLQYYFGQTMAREAAANQYTSISSNITAEMVNVGELNENIVELLASGGTSDAASDTDQRIRVYTQVLERNPLFYGVYVGLAGGDFFEVVNLDTSEQTRASLQARENERWVVITVDGRGDQRLRHFQYLDADLNSSRRRSEPTDFNASSRPWYQKAMASDGAYRTEPYLFSHLGVPGRTISRRIEGTDTVVAIDMTLDTLNRFLQDSKVSHASDLFLYSSDGQIIASSLSAAQPYKTVKMEKGSTASKGTPADLADDILIHIANNETLQGGLHEAVIGGRDYVVYGSSAIGTGENPLYVGIRAPTSSVLAPYLNKVKLSIAATSGFMLLLLPLSWLFATPIVEPVRQLAVENDKVRRREYDQVSRISSSVRELDELSESMVTMVSAIQTHEIEQRKLMDSFIQLIAEAIDDKSAYTGRHCERVPELAMMLAEQASLSDLPAFETFHLDSEDQWREYRIAAWLHDCGKITTPEHIVDKGSKLETIYNRIHEVRMRFEVLWRDAEISFWEKLCAEPDQKARLTRELSEQQQKLSEDFAFIAECNVGGEFFDDEKLDRLQRISRTTWQRNFDNQIGLSPLEELRKSAATAPLPVMEQLLSNRPEHIIERTRSTNYPPAFGIDMDIPEHLYNQGELYNLSIARGTLTEEDRFKINEHMISTIKMLESLPFPEELKNVPRYASTHHETMRGSGYPRKLPGDQLSIPERILAVADVFEALTAADRPYKKAKTVSDAIAILHRMVQDKHIDSDCFELFLNAGVYRQYAEQFLAPEQVDEVDIEQYLGSA